MNDFLRELNFLGVTARIKRLHDTLNSDIKALYQKESLDIEPSWHLVLLILKEEKHINLVEIANRLNISQPAITKVVHKMIEKGYVIKQDNLVDNRSKNLSLTAKATKAFPKWERTWDAGKKAVRELLQHNEHFMEALSYLEDETAQNSFKKRAIKFLTTD